MNKKKPTNPSLEHPVIKAMLQGMKTSGQKYAMENELREATYIKARAEGKSPREEWDRVKKTIK